MVEEDFKNKRTAILFADIKERSRLMSDHEDATISALSTYRTSIGKIVWQYRGRVLDSSMENVLIRGWQHRR
jgi:class 3 adenylate cyclase